MNEVTKKAIYDMCVNHSDVMVVDVMNHLHRFMWVHQDMNALVDGEPVCTGHLYGFTKFLLYLKEKFPKCAIVLALDGIDKSRREANSDYKAQRDHTYRVDSEMGELLKMCSLIEGLYVCHDEDYEADDVINVVSKTVKNICVKNDIQKTVYILSNDKDMYQCVTSGEICNINIIRKFGSGSEWFSGADLVDIDAVKEKFNGVCPKDLVKFRAIVGDASDNLRGYYRFRKANAAIIAENFDYIPEEGILKIKEGRKYCQSWMKFLPTITENMDTFRSNYSIMKLKEFDFEIVPISWDDYRCDVSEAVRVIKKYQLNQYLTNVPRYSNCKNAILESL